MMENFTFPEIDVQPGENEKLVQAMIRIPGKENTINFSVDIEKLGDSINIEELIKEISRELEKLSMTTSLLKTNRDMRNISKIGTALYDTFIEERKTDSEISVWDTIKNKTIDHFSFRCQNSEHKAKRQSH